MAVYTGITLQINCGQASQIDIALDEFMPCTLDDLRALLGVMELDTRARDKHVIKLKDHIFKNMRPFGSSASWARLVYIQYLNLISVVTSKWQRANEEV